MRKKKRKRRSDAKPHKRGGKRVGAGRPKLEDQTQIRASISSQARIKATADKHHINARHAADLLIELGYTYDAEYSGAATEAPPEQVRTRLSAVAARVRAMQAASAQPTDEMV